ncbi:acyltransferase family protein [Alishewanella longhuensis]
MTDAGQLARRYELDWLRVLAFALLIFYHTGMLYVERWGFHYKSQYLSSTLEYLMLASSPWRMLLIWLISGYAFGSVLRRLNHWRQYSKLALTRTVVLLLPLMVGLWLIVPPQLYAEMVQKDGLTLSYWQFYQAFFDLSHPLFNDYRRGVWPHVDVNHLWYLRSLWKFTLVLLLLAPLLYWSPVQQRLSRFFALPLCWQLLGCCLFLFISRYWLEGDAKRDVQGFGYFLLGALLVGQPPFWQKLAEARSWLGWGCFGNYLLLCGLYYFYTQPALLPSALQPLLQICLLGSFVLQAALVVWWLLALAERYLNKPHRYLNVANRTVFPIYLVHQSAIIIAALYLTPFQLGGALEAALVLLFTLVASVVFVGVFWYLPWCAALVGLKTTHVFSQWQQRLGYALGLIIVTPLALTLLL